MTNSAWAIVVASCIAFFVVLHPFQRINPLHVAILEPEGSRSSKAEITFPSVKLKAPFVYRRILEVCRSCNYTAPSQAIAVVQDYDLILIQAGTYADCAVLPPTAHIWMRGVGGMAHFTERVCEGKAALVANGPQTIIENFEFSRLRIPCEMGQNAVGIRLQAGDLVINNSYFHDSQGGVLTASTLKSNVTIANSRFSRLGQYIDKCISNPFTWFHSIYVGVEANFTLTNTMVEDNSTGNLVKSRAYHSVIKCNRIANGYNPEYPKNGFLIDLPQGGDEHIERNVIAQGPHVGSQKILVAYGAEIQSRPSPSEANPIQLLELAENTFFNDSYEATFLEMFSPTSKAAAVTKNLLVGSGLTIGGTSSSAVETDNRKYPTRFAAGKNVIGLPPIFPNCVDQ